MKKFEIKFNNEVIANVSQKGDDFDLSYVSEVVTESDVNRIYKRIGKEMDLKEINIDTLTLNKSVKEVSPRAFSNKKIRKIIIDGSELKTIGAFAFAHCDIEEIKYNYKFDSNGYIKDGVTNIYKGAFSNNKLTEVFLPNTLLVIEDKAFANNNLTRTAVYENNLDLIQKRLSIFWGNEENKFFNAAILAKKNS